MVRASDEPSEIVARVAIRLQERGETLALAESCTGGRVASLLTAYPGISEVFLGSVVAYDNAVKVDLLDVSNSVLKTFGAVSSEVALQMSIGARQKCRASWGIGVTGIAGPSGGSVEKPVGTVFFGLSGPSVEETEVRHFSGSRSEIQAAAAEHALNLLVRFLGS